MSDSKEKKPKELLDKIEQFAAEARTRLSKLRVLLWVSKRHAYQCGFYDGMKHAIDQEEK